MLGLARIGANELDETVKSHLVAMMTQTLIKKNLADISNADDAYIDAYLRHLGVVGGFEGIYFTKSLYFKDGSDDIILIADYKVRLIRLFENDIEFHFVQSAVTKAWMVGGLAESETTGTTLVTGEKLSDLTGEELRAKIVDTYGEETVEKLEEEYPDDTSNWSYNDWMYFMYFSNQNVQSTSQTEVDNIGASNLKSIINVLQNTPPQQLLEEGWVDITNPKMAANTTSREFLEPKTGLKVRFDKGVDGANGFEAVDHYHIMNPNYTNKKVDYYFDINGNPVGKGSKASHIVIKRKD